ncbi:hypothetical protein PRIPAC_87413 [Pristionchus pacificus]|uniref:Uncharacterized protein n=1 Tax=Pristionchus pacificus TaxID=54126 RepID=A0A454Y0B4_PRIPA|nr:hypothetical protein PRIPAC_87413 [Pristionchus pacificus]|eukprot:PDM62118.1 hypothetical protein PRIPAC_51560 [Pristionchus pacificus]
MTATVSMADLPPDVILKILEAGQESPDVILKILEAGQESPDVILKILEAGQEAIGSVKLLSHEWLLSSEEHLNDRKKLPALDSFRWHISDKGTTTLSMRYPAKYHHYFGINNWQFGPIPYGVDPKQIVKVDSRPLAAKVVAREVFAPRLNKLFGRCSRVGLLELCFDVFEQEAEVDIVQIALRNVPVRELALMRQRELDDQAMDAINDLVDALCPTVGIVISAMDYEVDGLRSRSFYLFLRKLFKRVSTVKFIFGTDGSRPQPFWQDVINSLMNALKVRVTLELEKFDNGKGRVALKFEERQED